MKQKGPKDLSTVFDSHYLKKLQDKAKQIAQLNQMVLSYLPESIRPHCHIANIKTDTLIFNVDSAAWASKLAYSERDIIFQLNRNHDINLKKIICKVEKPPLSPEPPQPPKRHINKMSNENAEYIAAMAESISDPKLAEALARLAKRKR